MRLPRLLVACAVAPVCFVPTEARAADVTGSVSVVSDYRYRGVSLSEGKPAFQAEVAADLGRGFYASGWASTIRDDGLTQSELDATFGNEIELHPNLSLDVSLTYYSYPASASDNYLESSAILSGRRGNLTGNLGFSYAPPQGAIRNDNGSKRGNAYYFGSAEWQLPKSPLKLTASLGYERGPFDVVASGGKWDWSVGVAAQIKSGCASVTLVDSDAASPAFVGSIGFNF